MVFSWLEWLFANPILPDITTAHFNFGESPVHFSFARGVPTLGFSGSGGAGKTTNPTRETAGEARVP